MNRIFQHRKPSVILLWRNLLPDIHTTPTVRGDAQLRARIARKLQEENHAPFQPENILITPGAKYAVYLTIRALSIPEMKLPGSHPAGFLTRPS